MGSRDKNVMPQDDSMQSCLDYIQAFSTQIIPAQSRVSNASTEVAQSASADLSTPKQPFASRSAEAPRCEQENS